MKNLYFKNTFVGTFKNEEDLKVLKENYIKELKRKLLEIDDLTKELYDKREVDTNEEYLEFLKKINSNFVSKLEDIKNIFFEDNFLGYAFLGKTLSTISIKIKDENAKRGKNYYSLATIFMNLSTNKYDEYFNEK